MNKKGYFMTLFLLACALVSCEKEHRNGEGVLRVQMATNGELKSSVTRADSKEVLPDVSDFSLTILRGENVQATWDKFSQYPDEVVFPVGTYVAKASYGQIHNEGFGLPYYEGQQEFVINDGKETNVSVTCRLANCRVSVLYTDAFKKYFSSYSAEVNSVGNSPITFGQTETRAAYFKPDKLSFYLSVKKQGASSDVRLFARELAVEAQHEYRVKMDVDAGTSTLNITFDDTVDEQPLEIDISDEALNAQPPYFKLTGYESGVAQDVIEGNKAEAPSVRALLNAPSGILGCMLKTTSASLLAQGWPAEIDLASVTAGQLAMLQKLGLKLTGLGTNKENMAIIDFSEVIPHLGVNLAGSENLFTLRAIDKYSRTSEDAVLKINVLDNQFSVGALPTLKIGTTKVVIPVTLASDPVQALKVEYNGYGTYHPIDFKIVSTSGITHQVEINFPEALVEEMPMRMVCGQKQKEFTLSVLPPVYEVKTLSDAGAWATRAILYVVGEDAATTNYLKDKEVKVQVQLANTTEWVEPTQVKVNDQITITGLKAGSTYQVKASCKLDEGAIAGQKNSSFTTEQILQVSNAGMEQWYYTRPSGVNYWEVWYACADGETPVWNTLNQKTTSEGGSNTGAFAGGSRDGCRYNANSGTIQTTDKHSGNYAALIRAVGWGKGNSATGSANAKYGDIGHLYIGTYDAETRSPVYSGCSFASRPSAMTFYYKYAPGKGGDQYLAEVVVQHRENGSVTELGRGTLRKAENVGVYTLANVPIVYNENAQTLKATHMYIVFKSGDKSNNDSFQTVPSFGNLSDGEFVGSQLYVDDIELVY